MLLCQYFRGCHHSRLVSVLYRQVGGSGSYHGLAAAHIALDQPIHGSTPLQIGGNVRNCPALGAGEPEGEGIVKGRQRAIFVWGAFFGCPLGGGSC